MPMVCKGQEVGKAEMQLRSEEAVVGLPEEGGAWG